MKKLYCSYILRGCLWLFAGLAMLVSTARGQSVICAVVKIKIAQTLSLERQAFDARMIINNGVDHLSLENLSEKPGQV